MVGSGKAYSEAHSRASDLFRVSVNDFAQQPGQVNGLLAEGSKETIAGRQDDGAGIREHSLPLRC